MGKNRNAKRKPTRYIPFDYTEQTGDGVEDGGEHGEAEESTEFIERPANGSTSVASPPPARSGTFHGAAPKEAPNTTASEEAHKFPPHVTRILEQVLDEASQPDAMDTSLTNLGSTDNKIDETGNQAQAPPLRGMAMNQYGAQPGSRQTPRLQNTQKTGLGNGNAGAGWAFGAPASGNAFGGLAGGAPGLAQRPQPLSGFAHVMGGGSGQGPIDMRYVLCDL